MNVFEGAVAAVPDTFRAGLESEFGPEGIRWLGRLPRVLESLCGDWGLDLADPTPRHGYLSLVWQVIRDTDTLALKLTMPTPAFERETSGLLAWNGRGMVQLFRRDIAHGAALLQWLDASISLEDIPIADAITVVGGLLTRSPALDTTDASRYGNALTTAQATAKSWLRRSRLLGDPLTPAAIAAGRHALGGISRAQSGDEARLVNHDLHYGNMIRDWEQNWLCIDPKPVVGVPEYALAPLIWRRYSNPQDSVERVRKLCAIAQLSTPIALDWLLIRLIDYMLWARESGLTSDPAICKEIIDYLAAQNHHQF